MTVNASTTATATTERYFRLRNNKYYDLLYISEYQAFIIKATTSWL